MVNMSSPLGDDYVLLLCRLCLTIMSTLVAHAEHSVTVFITECVIESSVAIFSQIGNYETSCQSITL